MSPAPDLRLFSPGSRPRKSDITPAMTLGQFYELCFVPLWVRARGLSPASSASFAESIAWWRELTEDPPLCKITDFVCAKFVADLQQQPGRRGEQLAAYTVNKHARQVQRMLDFAGPKTRERRGRRNLAVISDVPFVESPRLPDLAPDGDFSLEEMRAIYQAAALMTRPAALESPPAWWRAIVVAAAKTGLRIGQLRALRWQDLLPAEGLPGAWITVTHEAHRSRKGLRQYLPQEALIHIHANRQDEVLLFPWPCDPRWLQISRQRLQELAGLPENRQFGFHGFRRWNTTALRRSGFAASQKLAQAAAGHADTRTTLAHYINATVEELILAESLEALPPVSRCG